VGRELWPFFAHFRLRPRLLRSAIQVLNSAGSVSYGVGALTAFFLGANDALQLSFGWSTASWSARAAKRSTTRCPDGLEHCKPGVREGVLGSPCVAPRHSPTGSEDRFLSWRGRAGNRCAPVPSAIRGEGEQLAPCKEWAAIEIAPVG